MAEMLFGSFAIALLNDGPRVQATTKCTTDREKATAESWLNSTVSPSGLEL